MAEVLSRQERLATLIDELLQTMPPEEAIPPLLAALVATCTRAGIVPGDVLAQFLTHVPRAAGMASEVVGTVRSVARIVKALR